MMALLTDLYIADKNVLQRYFFLSICSFKSAKGLWVAGALSLSFLLP